MSAGSWKNKVSAAMESLRVVAAIIDLDAPEATDEQVLENLRDARENLETAINLLGG